MKIKETLIIIRGAGDLATGTAIELYNAGFPVIMLETEQPTVIRRTVAFASAVYCQKQVVDNVTAVKCSIDEAFDTAETGIIAVVIDSDGVCIERLKPAVVIDAILAKKNLGTSKDMADFVVALGPGFTAGVDCHVVVETQRGSSLGKVIYQGSAIPNTGIPGIICGVGEKRVLHSPCDGVFRSNREIGDIVCSGDVVAFVDNVPVVSEINGKIRGMLFDGLKVTKGFKIGDVDPRGKEVDHNSCSDKARAIGKGVLEAVMNYLEENR